MPRRAMALQALLGSDQGRVDSLWLGIDQPCMRVVKEGNAPVGGGADTILMGVTDRQGRDRNGAERCPEQASDLGGDRHPIRSHADNNWVPDGDRRGAAPVGVRRHQQSANREESFVLMTSAIGP